MHDGITKKKLKVYFKNKKGFLELSTEVLVKASNHTQWCSLAQNSAIHNHFYPSSKPGSAYVSHKTLAIRIYKKYLHRAFCWLNFRLKRLCIDCQCPIEANKGVDFHDHTLVCSDAEIVPLIIQLYYQ